MPLHNPQAAEKLLRLFDLPHTWSDLETRQQAGLLDPALKNISDFIRIVDETRHGQIVAASPSHHLLDAAYLYRVRLRFAAPTQDRSGTYSSFIEIIKNGITFAVVDVYAHHFQGPFYIFLQQLNTATFGVKKVNLGLQDIGAAIFNGLSMCRASFQKAEVMHFDPRYHLHYRLLHAHFSLKKHWNFDTFSQDQLQLVRDLLIKSFHDSGHNGLSISCEIKPPSCRISCKGFFGDAMYFKNTTELQLDVMIQASDTSVLNAIDFVSAYNKFALLANEASLQFHQTGGQNPTRISFIEKKRLEDNGKKVSSAPAERLTVEEYKREISAYSSRL